jgi:hypothetical protein
VPDGPLCDDVFDDIDAEAHLSDAQYWAMVEELIAADPGDPREAGPVDVAAVIAARGERGDDR